MESFTYEVVNWCGMTPFCSFAPRCQLHSDDAVADGGVCGRRRANPSPFPATARLMRATKRKRWPSCGSKWCERVQRFSQKNVLDNSLFIRLGRIVAARGSHLTTGGKVMTIGQSLLSEFDQEMQNTRKVLERCPEEKWNWKPHDKSGTLGWLAGHVATMVDWLPTTIRTAELDYAPVGGPSFTPPKIDNRQQLLAEFDKNVSAARAALAGVSDAEMMKNWRLLAGGREIFSLPRAACIRGMVLNHHIHHRAQLTVYLRLLNVAVPGLYGPSGDEIEPNAAAN